MKRVVTKPEDQAAIEAETKAENAGFRMSESLVRNGSRCERTTAQTFIVGRRSANPSRSSCSPSALDIVRHIVSILWKHFSISLFEYPAPDDPLHVYTQERVNITQLSPFLLQGRRSSYSSFLRSLH